MSRTVAIENARIVTPDEIVRGCVVIEGARIAAIGSDSGTRQVDERIDARGLFLLPGLIDLHGDDIERHLFPRNGSRIDVLTALTAADRANLVAGITTKFHAVAFEDAPDENRTIDLARELVDSIGTAETLLVDHRNHLRCELTTNSLDAVTRTLREDGADLVSVMHHVPGEGQFVDRGQFAGHYVDDRGFDQERVDRLIDERKRIAGDVLDERLHRVATTAAETGVPLASHDDETPARVERMLEYGATISEFPTSLEAATRAKELGMHTAMGAPNLVRGGSMWGNLDVADAIDAGVLDILCSDYHPPSLLGVPFVETGEPLPERVARVTSAPADAVGMADRGRIETGTRGDLILVDPTPVPTVEHAFVAGVEIYRASPVDRRVPERSSRRYRPRGTGRR